MREKQSKNASKSNDFTKSCSTIPIFFVLSLSLSLKILLVLKRCSFFQWSKTSCGFFLLFRLCSEDPISISTRQFPFAWTESVKKKSPKSPLCLHLYMVHRHFSRVVVLHCKRTVANCTFHTHWPCSASRTHNLTTICQNLNSTTFSNNTKQMELQEAACVFAVCKCAVFLGISKSHRQFTWKIAQKKELMLIFALFCFTANSLRSWMKKKKKKNTEKETWKRKKNKPN